MERENLLSAAAAEQGCPHKVAMLMAHHATEARCSKRLNWRMRHLGSSPTTQGIQCVHTTTVAGARRSAWTDWVSTVAGRPIHDAAHSWRAGVVHR